MDEQFRLQLETLADHALAQLEHAAERHRAQARYLDPDDTERTRAPLGVDDMTRFATEAARDCIETAAVGGCAPKPSRGKPPEGLPDDLADQWRQVVAIAARVSSPC